MIKKVFSKIGKKIGPGIITGAADDDPSGIATYSIAGAKFNFSLLWTAILTWPLMAAVQMMCARIGMVTGNCLAKNLQKKFSQKLVIVISFILLFANIFNVSADLLAMADAAEILSKIDSHIWIAIFAITISITIINFNYQQISDVLKWLILALFTYVISAFYAKPDWIGVLQNTFSLQLPTTSEGYSMLVAILGTTISPYLFFWQTSQEVEEEISIGRDTIAKRVGASNSELRNRAFDVGIGTFFSNLVMFFIILTTALTLHKQGITNLETSTQIAKALEPVAGSMTMILYTAGLIGTGFLAVITLVGSSAYALSESFSWKYGLNNKLKQAKPFYAVILFATFSAVLLDFIDINPVKMLFYSALLNGILAPFLLIGIFLIARDKKIMHGQTSSKICSTTVLITIILMPMSLIGMFVF